MKKKRLKNFRLYLILDKDACGSNNLKYVLRRSIKGGVNIVQFRDKTSSTRQMIQEAMPLLKICRKHRIPFIINDRLDVAMAISSDGIHLGQDDMPVGACRSLLGPNKIIGLSCHRISEIRAAQKQKIDYLAFGPVFKTKTKPNLKPIGLNAFKKAACQTTLPIFAIGGISRNNAKQVRPLKNAGIAVCRELCQSKDPMKTARILKFSGIRQEGTGNCKTKN